MMVYSHWAVWPRIRGMPWILILLSLLLSPSTCRRSTTAAARSHTAYKIRTADERTLIYPRSKYTSAPPLSSRRPSSLDCLSTLRGGASDPYASGYRERDAYSHGLEPPPSRRHTEPRSDSGGYREDWEGAAAAGMRDRYQGGRGRQGEREEDDDYYHDRGLPTPRERRSGGGGRSSSFVPSVLSRGNKKVGLVLLAAGAALTMLGVSLFFNKALMRLGNLLVIAGVPLTLGPSRTLGYFLQPAKARATACLALGILLVFVGWPVFGIALELFGLLNLFGNMFPIFWAVAKQTPIVGNLLKRNEGDSSSRRRYYDDADDYDRRRKEEERYY